MRSPYRRGKAGETSILKENSKTTFEPGAIYPAGAFRLTQRERARLGRSESTLRDRDALEKDAALLKLSEPELRLALVFEIRLSQIARFVRNRRTPA